MALAKNKSSIPYIYGEHFSIDTLTRSTIKPINEKRPLITCLSATHGHHYFYLPQNDIKEQKSW
jgi:hypothetical protein